MLAGRLLARLLRWLELGEPRWLGAEHVVQGELESAVQ